MKLKITWTITQHLTKNLIMKKIIKSLTNRFHITFVRAFGFFIACDGEYTIQILFICIGIEIDFKDLLDKKNQKTF